MIARSLHVALDWQATPLPPALHWSATRWPAANSLHIWRFSPEWLLSLRGLGAVLLDEPERARLHALTAALKRDRFISVRSAVRCALASYLSCAPASLAFTKGPHGKPELTAQRELQFSISHAGGDALLAVAADSLVGVDLERIRQRPRDELAARLLGPAALERYVHLPEAIRDAGFAWAWAEREAYVKALGLGIGDGWQLANALFTRTELLAAPLSAACRGVGGWVLHYLPLWPGHAAVACAGRPAEHIDIIEPQAHRKELVTQSLAVCNLS